MIIRTTPALRALLNQGGCTWRSRLPFQWIPRYEVPLHSDPDRALYRALTLRTSVPFHKRDSVKVGWAVLVIILLLASVARGQNVPQPPAVATALPPTHVEGQRVPLSVDLSGTLRIAGTAIEYTGSATLDIGAVNDGACVLFATPVTVNGAALGGRPTIGMDFEPPEGITISAKISASNAVKVQVCNATGSSYNPPSALYTVGVYQ